MRHRTPSQSRSMIATAPESAMRLLLLRLRAPESRQGWHPFRASRLDRRRGLKAELPTSPPCRLHGTQAMRRAPPNTNAPQADRSSRDRPRHSASTWIDWATLMARVWDIHPWTVTAGGGFGSWRWSRSLRRPATDSKSWAYRASRRRWRGHARQRSSPTRCRTTGTEDEPGAPEPRVAQRASADQTPRSAAVCFGIGHD